MTETRGGSFWEPLKHLVKPDRPDFSKVLRAFLVLTAGEKMARGGRRQQIAGMNDAQRAPWVEAHKIPGTKPELPQETSRIGWAMENVEAAYEAAGMEARRAQMPDDKPTGPDRGTGQVITERRLEDCHSWEIGAGGVIMVPPDTWPK
jgi:hypothetical protein